MKRILILYSREWPHPRPDATAGYLHQVFSRTAAQGYVDLGARCGLIRAVIETVRAPLTTVPR